MGHSEERMPNVPGKGHQGWHILKNILFYLFLFLVVCFAILSLDSHANGGSLRFGNDEVRIVLSGSMDGEATSYAIPTIKTGSAVVISDVPSDEAELQKFYSQLSVGDILTFTYHKPDGSTVLVTHRIIRIEYQNGDYQFTLKGDADGGTQFVASSDNLVVGKVKSASYPWGVFLVFLSGKWGILVLVIIPALAICFYECGKIIALVKADKKSAADAKLQAEQARVAELEKQVASLKQSKDDRKEEDQ